MWRGGAEKGSRWKYAPRDPDGQNQGFYTENGAAGHPRPPGPIEHLAKIGQEPS